jgi:p-aminobenzoyl-glutamate transporter AbgT
LRDPNSHHVNYKRGFKRLYVVAVAVWILFVIALAIEAPVLRENALSLIVVAITVPPVVAYFVLFFLIPWIVRGFRSHEK